MTCPQCGKLVPPGVASCGGCGHGLAWDSGLTLTLEFPAEPPDPDGVPLDALPPAPAPTLMPGPPEPPQPPPVSPTEQDRRKRTAAVAGAAVGGAAVIVIAVIVAVALVGPSGSPTASSAGAESQAIATTAPTTTSSPVPTDENSAHQMLTSQAANDRSQVEALTEYWVPQLSSKRPGLVANGITYDYQAIWSDFVNLRQRYPGALLLWSGDYSSFRYQDFWVVIASASFPSGESANGWCDSAGIGKDDCFAKRISHTGSYADSTLHRK
jgi:hypothetical protein